MLTVNLSETRITWEKGMPVGDCLYHSWIGKTHLNCEWYLSYISGKRQLKISMYSCTQWSLLTLNIMWPAASKSKRLLCDFPVMVDCNPVPSCLCWGIYHSNRRETTTVCAAGDLTQDSHQTNRLSLSYVPSSWCLENYFPELISFCLYLPNPGNSEINYNLHQKTII